MVVIDKRSAIVTGSAQGIGRGIAIRLARDGLQMTVSDLACKETELRALVSELEAEGHTARYALCDVSERSEVDDLVGGHVAEFGKLDVMVANAGVVVTQNFLEHTQAQLDRVLAINIGGVWNCYQAAARTMIASGTKGRLIGASSGAGYRGWRMQSAYSASKFAVRGLTQAVAEELAPTGITVNCYCPGIIETPMWDYIDKATTDADGRKAGEELESVVSQVPMGRSGSPEDVASVVSFLASKDSAYMTGQSMVVDGGLYFA